MSTVDFTNRLSLREAAELIAAIGTTNTILLKGEKGIGKSSIYRIDTFITRHGDHII